MNLKKFTLLCLAAIMIPTGVVLPTGERKPKPTMTESVKDHWKAFKKWITVEKFCCGVLGVIALYLGWNHYNGGTAVPGGNNNGGRPQGPPEVPCAHNYTQRLVDAPAPQANPDAPDMGRIVINAAIIEPNQDRQVQVTLQQRRVVDQAPKTRDFKGHACGMHSAVNLTLGAQAEAGINNVSWNQLRDHNVVGQRVEQAGQNAEQVVAGRAPLNPVVNQGVLVEDLVDYRTGEADINLVHHLLANDQAQCPAGHADVVSFNNLGAPQGYDVNALRQNGIHRVNIHDSNRRHHFGVIINRQGNNSTWTILDSVNSTNMQNATLNRLMTHVEFDTDDHDAIQGLYQLKERQINPHRIGQHGIGVVTQRQCQKLGIRMPAAPAPQPQ